MSLKGNYVDTKTVFRPGMLRGAGKAVALADAIDRGTQAVTDFQQGDNLMGGYNALRAGAGVMAARGNPVAAAFVGGSMAGDLIGKALPEDVRMGIGAATNAVVRKAGDLVGQKWGVDDSALTDGPGASNTTRSPLKAPQAGRSTVLNASNYKDPGTPGVSAFDRTADVRSAINTGRIPDSLRDGRIWNSGNMYAGANVEFGAPIVNAKTGMNREGRGNFSVIDNSAQRAYVQGVLREAEARRAAQAAAQAAAQPNVLPRGDSGLRNEIYSQLTRQPREPSYRYQARVGALLNFLGDNTKNETNLRDNMTSRANNEASNATTRRGQDLTYVANLHGDETARIKALQEQYDKDREFILNLTREQRAAREAGEKQVLDRVIGMLPLTGDPEKDGPMKATALQRLNQLYGQQVAELRSYLRKNPNDAASRQQLQYLEQNGLAAFAGNEEGLLRYLQGSAVRDAANRDASWWNPFKGESTGSTQPVTGPVTYEESALSGLRLPLWGEIHEGYAKLPDGSTVRLSQLSYDQRRLYGLPTK